MNTLRSFFNVRSIAALGQSLIPNSGATVVEPSSPPSLKRSNSQNNNVHCSRQPPAANNLNLVKQTRVQLKNGTSISLPLEKLETKKLKLVYTCKKCMTRNAKIISHAAYCKGVVIVQCDGCATNHLIVDNLGWFSNNVHGLKSIDDVIAANANSVVKIAVNERGELLSKSSA